jgi:hypothetical protein
MLTSMPPLQRLGTPAECPAASAPRRFARSPTQDTPSTPASATPKDATSKLLPTPPSMPPATE